MSDIRKGMIYLLSSSAWFGMTCKWRALSCNSTNEHSGHRIQVMISCSDQVPGSIGEEVGARTEPSKTFREGGHDRIGVCVRNIDVIQGKTIQCFDSHCDPSDVSSCMYLL